MRWSVPPFLKRLVQARQASPVAPPFPILTALLMLLTGIGAPIPLPALAAETESSGPPSSAPSTASERTVSAATLWEIPFGRMFPLFFARPEVAESPPVEVFEPSEPPPLHLYGVVIVEPGLRLAFMHDGMRSGRLRKVREGQTISGALVKFIFPDRVTLFFAGEEFDILLWSPKDGQPETGLGADGEPASLMSPQPLRSSDLSIPLIHRQPLYPTSPEGGTSGEEGAYVGGGGAGVDGGEADGAGDEE